MNFKFLLDKIVLADGLIKLKPSEFTDINQVRGMVADLEKLFKEISIFNDKGFINDAKVNIPAVDLLIKGLKFKNNDFAGSVVLNTLYYNLILLLMKKLCIDIALWLKDRDVDEDRDLSIDLKNLRYEIKRMIHPSIVNKLQNKGISLLLNNITGYDSEYELQSSLEKVNELLSVQLASVSSLYVKIPIIDKEALTVSDLNIREGAS